MEPLIREKLADYYRAVEAGSHSPAARYRLEGYLQALIEQQLINRDRVVQLISSTYQEVFNGEPPLEPVTGEELQLPHRTPLAPVYKPGEEPS